MIDICFMVDIIVQFNTAFYKRGTLIFSRWEIAKNYFWSWFLIDFVASFPYAQVFSEDKIAQEFELDPEGALSGDVGQIESQRSSNNAMRVP